MSYFINDHTMGEMPDGKNDREMKLAALHTKLLELFEIDPHNFLISDESVIDYILNPFKYSVQLRMMLHQRVIQLFMEIIRSEPEIISDEVIDIILTDGINSSIPDITDRSVIERPIEDDQFIRQLQRSNILLNELIRLIYNFINFDRVNVSNKTSLTPQEWIHLMNFAVEKDFMIPKRIDRDEFVQEFTERYRQFDQDLTDQDLARITSIITSILTQFQQLSLRVSYDITQDLTPNIIYIYTTIFGYLNFLYSPISENVSD